MPLQNAVDESMRVLETSAKRGVTLRLLGGVAFYLRSSCARRENMARTYGDIDFVGHTRQSSEIKSIFGELGYSPRERFNVMQGYRRLIFTDAENGRRADIFLDVFEMCHRFDLKERIELDTHTIPLADLMATKLQIVELNEKDARDMVCLLVDHEVGEIDSETINGAYLARLCSHDWGIYKTFTVNLGKLPGAAARDLHPGEVETVEKRVRTLLTMIEAQPKSLRWKARAAVGERVRWYELPEEDMVQVAQTPTGAP